MSIRTTIFLSVLTTTLVLPAASFVSANMTKQNLTAVDSFVKSFQPATGAWMFSDKVGSPAASSLERARIALGGPLALSAEETIYFLSVEDDDGELLNSSCTYRVTGEDYDARWWSLTLYDSDTQNYVENEDRRSSWTSEIVRQAPGQNWDIKISPSEQDGYWLPSQTESGRNFDLILRMYNPSPNTRANALSMKLPQIERTIC